MTRLGTPDPITCSLLIALLYALTPPFSSNLASDTVALGAMAALRAHGVRIPEDVAVVGYDDRPLTPYAAPPLTTVRSPALEHGRLAAEMLIRLIHGEFVDSSNVTLDTKLVERSSCGARMTGSSAASP